MHYDPAKVRRADLLRWLQLSPNIADSNSYLVPESILYDMTLPNFFRSYEANLEKINRRIASLNSDYYPRQLEPVVSYFNALQRAFLAKDTARLKYLRTWNTSELAKPISGLNVGQRCAASIAEIRNALDEPTRYKLVSFGWGNCVSRLIMERVGTYPQSAWGAFLKAYSIREKFVPTEVN